MSVPYCGVSWFTLRPSPLCLFHQIPGAGAVPAMLSSVTRAVSPTSPNPFHTRSSRKYTLYQRRAVDG